MKNITITLEENVASWARIRAAERETSVSRLVGEMLKEKMLEEESYGASMQHYLSKPPILIKKPGTRYPIRENLHENHVIGKVRIINPFLNPPESFQKESMSR